MRILIDVDGVLADTHTEWMRRYNADYNDNLKSSDVTRWGTHEFVKPECGTKIYDYLWDETLYDGVFPIKGSQSGVDALRKMGHRCVFVTSGIQPAKIKWLYRFGFLTSKIWQSDPDVAIVNDKSLIEGDLLIDDRDKNVDDFIHTFNADAILFNQPWNQEYNKVYRANNWNDVLAYVEAVGV